LERNQTRPVVLLTDFGLQDPFAGILKGVIACISPESSVMDLSHGVAPQDIVQGAFLLTTSYSYFPKGSVFCVVVDPGVGSDRKGILIETRDYFFIGPDNGVLWHAANENNIKQMFHLTHSACFLSPVSKTFHGRDIFAPVAAHVSKGIKSLSILGNPIKECVRLDFPEIKKRTRSSLVLTVIHIDRFGNCALNIDGSSFMQFVQNKSFCLTVNSVQIKSAYDTYSQARDEDPFLIVSSCSYMEISLKNSNAANMMRIQCMDEGVLEILES